MVPLPSRSRRPYLRLGGIVAIAGGVAALVYAAAATVGPYLLLANALRLPLAGTDWAAGTAPGLLFARLSSLLPAASPGAVFAAVAFNALIHVATAVTIGALRFAYERERVLARTDALTGAPNRRAFDEDVHASLHAHARDGRPLTAVLIDLDGFKRVNDMCGHDEGDEVLRVVARTLGGSARAGDIVARYGGDEFAVLLTGADAGAASALLLRLHAALDAAMALRSWPVTFSIGAVSFARPPACGRQLMRLVDAQMYEAKHGGKSRVRHCAHEA